MYFFKLVPKSPIVILLSLVFLMLTSVPFSMAEEGEERRSGVGKLDAVSFSDGKIVIDDRLFTIMDKTEYSYPSGFTSDTSHFTVGVLVSWEANTKMELFTLSYISATGKSTDGSSGDSSKTDPEQKDIDIKLDNGVYHN